ncbi:hypothetical protein [Streptomyces sp. NPDC091209]|uniref:hypothetical protein n=1 Tax=Streptomyces sp. NPDC091209 TaxID=3365974 RepID=UPI0038266BB1
MGWRNSTVCEYLDSGVAEVVQPLTACVASMLVTPGSEASRLAAIAFGNSNTEIPSDRSRQ